MRRQWSIVFTELERKKTINPELFYPGKYFSEMKVNKGFQTYKTYKHSSLVDPTLQEMLKEVFRQ